MNKKPYLVPHTQEPIKILYQDEDLILVKKPDLLLSVPGRHPLNKDCLITRIQADFPTATMVHRLDLDTSGIMVIPLNKSTHSNISRQFQERKVFKEYVAEVFGRMNAKTDVRFGFSMFCLNAFLYRFLLDFMGLQRRRIY